MNNKKQEIIKALLITSGRQDLISKIGKVPDYVILEEIFNTVPDKLKPVVSMVINKEKEIANVKQFTSSLDKKHRTVITSDMANALLAGISLSTYKKNKKLPFEDKLKLPVEEFIFAIEVKEKNKDKK